MADRGGPSPLVTMVATPIESSRRPRHRPWADDAPAEVRRAIEVAAHVWQRLDPEPPLRHRPSADVLFRSASVLGPRALAAVLTGMGSDGTRGMAELAAAGGWTLAQDRESSVVYGMPRAAVEAGAVREVVALGALGSRLGRLLATGAPRGAG